jgi:hypothetical protein
VWSYRTSRARRSMRISAPALCGHNKPTTEEKSPVCLWVRLPVPGTVRLGARLCHGRFSLKKNNNSAKETQVERILIPRSEISVVLLKFCFIRDHQCQLAPNQNITGIMISFGMVYIPRSQNKCRSVRRLFLLFFKKKTNYIYIKY